MGQIFQAIFSIFVTHFPSFCSCLSLKVEKRSLTRDLVFAYIFFVNVNVNRSELISMCSLGSSWFKIILKLSLNERARKDPKNGDKRTRTVLKSDVWGLFFFFFFFFLSLNTRSLTQRKVSRNIQSLYEYYFSLFIFSYSNLLYFALFAWIRFQVKITTRRRRMNANGSMRIASNKMVSVY